MERVGSNDRAYVLKDVLDIPVLQRLQDTFAEAMGFAAVTVDKTGTPVTRNSSFRRICRLVRSTEAGLARCMKSDAMGGIKAKNLGRPCSYVCLGGLVDMAAPIIIEGEYLGCILCGQVVPVDARDEFIEDIMRRDLALGLPKEELLQAVEEIPSIPRERIDPAIEMLFLMASYIVKMGAANMMQAKLLEETREKAALQELLQSAQLRMLESQINPHFLFNALGLISYMAIQEEAPQTEEIAYCLSDLLRYSLRSTTGAATLVEEVEIIERYLAIQKLRFGSRLKAEIEVDSSLHQVRIPRMILQPLVENAVIHAVEPSMRPVQLHVIATSLPGGIKLEVIDDGAGMSQAVIEAVNSRSFNLGTDHRSALGLQNVVRRLEGEYGPEFSFHAESEAGKGSRVVITLPLNSNYYVARQPLGVEYARYPDR